MAADLALLVWASESTDLLRGHLSFGHCQFPCRRVWEVLQGAHPRGDYTSRRLRHPSDSEFMRRNHGWVSRMHPMPEMSAWAYG